MYAYTNVPVILCMSESLLTRRGAVVSFPPFRPLTYNEERPEHETVQVPPQERQGPVAGHVQRVHILEGQQAGHVADHVKH